MADHAELPAQSFLAPPADAPAVFNVSGRLTGEGRTEQLYAIQDEATGLSRPSRGSRCRAPWVSAAVATTGSWC